MRTVETQGTKVLQIIDGQTVRVLKSGAIAGTVMNILDNRCPRNIFDGNTKEELEDFIRTADTLGYAEIESAATAAMTALGHVVYKDPPAPPPGRYKIVRIMDSKHFVGERNGKNSLVYIGKHGSEGMECVTFGEFADIIRECSPKRLIQLGLQMSEDELAGLRTTVKKMFQSEPAILEWLNFNER